MSLRDFKIYGLFVILGVILCSSIVYMYVKKNNDISQTITTEKQIHSNIKENIGFQISNNITEEIPFSENNADDITANNSFNYTDENIIKESEYALNQAVFESEYADPRKLVKVKWREGIPYSLTCRIITKDKLPLLYEMLNDQEYAPYWHHVSKIIGYISNDPGSVPVLLNYFQRDDGENVSSLEGKIWSIAFIGKIGSNNSDEILRNAFTEEGAIELSKAWIDKKIPHKYMSRRETIDYIRNAAMRGLIFTGKEENIELIKNLYEKEYTDYKNSKKMTKICYYLIDALAINDFIADNSIGKYLDTSNSKLLSELWPYMSKYSDLPPLPNNN